MRLAYPWFLALLVVLPLLWRWYRSERSSPPALRYSDLRIVTGARSTNRASARWLPNALRVAVLILLAVAIARPQYGVTQEKVASKGIDIVMVLDNSGSMGLIDPEPGAGRINPDNTRLSVAKRVIEDFVSRRRNDRIGLVKFAGKAYYQCPLTLDYGILLTFLDTIQLNEKDPQTAIGDAIGTAVLHLKDSDAKSKVAVLVTDGESNAGMLSPEAAAEAAAQYDIKIYTVGVGNPSGAVKYVEDFFGGRFVPVRSGLDEVTLKNIAGKTGAKYFHATDPSSMKKIFHKIDEMEKTEIKTERYTEYSERFMPWAWLALGLLAFEVLLSTGPMRTLP